MNKMTYRELAKQIFIKGKEKMDDMEVYIERNKQTKIGIFEGEIDTYTIAESEGLSLRGISGNKMGYAYTEKVDPSSIDRLIHDAYENGQYMDGTDKERIFSSSDPYKTIEEKKCDLNSICIKDKIQFVKQLEKEALQWDPRVVAVDGCMYQEIDSRRYIINTKGLDLEDGNHLAIVYVSVIVKEGEDTKTGMGYRITKEFATLDSKEIAKEAVEEALSMLGARTIKTGNYPVIFRNDAFADLVGAYRSIFYAENVQKGLSLLKGKVGQSIANNNLTLIDDPFLKEGFISQAFDDEGIATQYRKIIDKGILQTYLYNGKAAEKDHVPSTGHGHRNSYKSSISTSTTNFYIEKGKVSFDDLIQGMEHGLLIIDLQGLHSGLNTVSGDYSLSAYGYEIENGKIKRPVNQITIAGNFFDTLKNIEEVGNDLKFNMSLVGSPSVKIRNMSVAGE